MPDQLTEAQIELLKAVKAKKLLPARKSPLGFDEYMLPDNHPAFTGNNDAVTIGDKVFYAKSAFNNPVVQTHERIHVGQNMAGYSPSIEELKDALSPLVIQTPRSKEPWDTYEPPAYAFERYRPGAQQDAFNNYINLMAGIPNEGSLNIESSMPDALMRSYIKSGTGQGNREFIKRQYAPTISVQPQSYHLSSLLRSILAGRK